MAKEHKFGIVVFVRETKVDTYPTTAHIPRPENDDPFCYVCGQKAANARGTDCPGPEDNNSRNVMLPDLTKVH